MADPHDAALAELADLMDRFGWAIRHVVLRPGESGYRFSYTIGLSRMGYDELIVTGLGTDAAQTFLQSAVKAQQDGGRYVHGSHTPELSYVGEVWFIEAISTEGMTATSELLGDFPALQLVWPDSEGSLPWDPDYRNDLRVQPLLGVPPQS